MKQENQTEQKPNGGFMEHELCPKCGQPMFPGELVTGHTPTGDGGEHIMCPIALLATEQAPLTPAMQSKACTASA